MLSYRSLPTMSCSNCVTVFGRNFSLGGKNQFRKALAILLSGAIESFNMSHYTVPRFFVWIPYWIRRDLSVTRLEHNTVVMYF